MSSFAQPPSFSGVYVSGITSNSATISCNINGNNSLTTGYFAISTSVNDLLYGSPGTLAFSSITANVVGLQSRNKTFGGLLPSTTYYYRAVASNTWGQTVSSYASFQTLPSPIENVSVTDVTNTSAKINYTANGQAVYSNVSYGFATNNYYGLQAGIQTNLLPSVTSFVPLTNLAPGTTYFVRVNAQSNAIGSYSSQEVSFTTTGTNVGPAISTVTSDAITGTSANVNCTIFSQNLAHSSTVKYGTSASDLNMQTTVDNVAAGIDISVKNITLSDLTSNTLYYYKVEATNANGTTASAVQNFTTLLVTVPTISNVSHSAGINSAIVSYTLTPNNSATTSVLNYGLSPETMTNEITGLATTTSSISGSVDITGLQPNTTYFYSVKATNGLGISNSPVTSFTTTSVTSIAYNFDGTYTDTSGNGAFTPNPGTSFTTDRNGNANSAININNSGAVATILGLPYGSSLRTISVWAKINVLNNQINYVFHYGNAANGNGLALRPTTTLYFANAAANLETTDTNSSNTWIHYVCTYDGTTAKVYKNGVLFSSGAKTFNTVNNSNLFRLGISEGGLTNYFNGAIDDLKIYDYVLNDTEIASLYANNTLSSSDFAKNNKEINLFPNPANDFLNIETTLDLKSVEIYTIQGQKVVESNQKQINVSNLVEGIYLVKIKDSENNEVTKKIIIK